MAKFAFRLVEKDKTWTAQITRKVSARKTNVTKSKAGFASEQEAQKWAKDELETLSSKVSERRRAVKVEKEKQKEIEKLKAASNDE